MEVAGVPDNYRYGLAYDYAGDSVPLPSTVGGGGVTPGRSSGIGNVARQRDNSWTPRQRNPNAIPERFDVDATNDLYKYCGENVDITLQRRFCPTFVEPEPEYKGGFDFGFDPNRGSMTGGSSFGPAPYGDPGSKDNNNMMLLVGLVVVVGGLMMFKNN